MTNWTPLCLLTFDSRHRVDIALEGSYVTAGVGHCDLCLKLGIHGTWLDSKNHSDCTPLLLSGYLEATVHGTRRVAAFPTHTVTLYGWKVNDDISFALSTDQLLALDAERNTGGDMQLTLRLSGTLLRELQVVHPDSTAQLSFTLSVAEWLALLDQAGSEVGITVRVPSPLTDDGARAPAPDGPTETSRSQATARLLQARRHLREGRYEDCVATCRRVLENLEALSAVPSIKSLDTASREDRDAAQRWAALRVDLKSLASAAVHDDAVTRSFTWTRVDAEVVLAMTAAVAAKVLG